MTPERWIKTTLDSEEAGERVRLGTDACHRVHVWANETLLRTWLETMTVLTVNEMQPMLTYWLREQRMEKLAQRYSYDIALSRTINRFADTLRARHMAGDTVAEVALPKTLQRHEWPWLDIEERQVWQRYLENYGRLTSWYGNLYLEGDWPDTMKKYASDLNVGLDKLPLLWNSVTLRDPHPRTAEEREEDAAERGAGEQDLDEPEVWDVRFNFYRPQTQVGKRRIRKELHFDGREHKPARGGRKKRSETAGSAESAGSGEGD